MLNIYIIVKVYAITSCQLLDINDSLYLVIHAISANPLIPGSNPTSVSEND